MRDWLTDIQRCPWCGNFMIQRALKEAIKELGIPTEELVIVSGIWCSGKMSQYIDWYAAETLHGRAVPFALWVKLANPKLHVIVYWWDWDWYWIGLWHLLHACRRDINITYIVADNQNYALTTGQTSPTTPLDIHTSSDPAWNHTPPFHPIDLVAATWCRFNKTVSDKNLPEMKKILVDAIKFDWFAHINIQQWCPSYKLWE